MTEKVYSDSRSNCTVYTLNMNDVDDVEKVRSATRDGLKFLKNYGVSVNQFEKQFGEYVRHCSVGEYDYIFVENQQAGSRDVVYKLNDSPDTLQPINHPTSEETLKSVVRYCHNYLSIDPNLVLSHTSGYHPYEYVDSGVNLTVKEKNRVADHFSVYQINTELIL